MVVNVVKLIIIKNKSQILLKLNINYNLIKIGRKKKKKNYKKKKKKNFLLFIKFTKI